MAHPPAGHPTRDVVSESSDSESDEEADGEDNDGVDHQAPSGVTIARTPFKVNPFMDLKSVGLLDMVATKAVVAKNQIKVPLTTGPPETNGQLTVDEIFESFERE